MLFKGRQPVWLSVGFPVRRAHLEKGLLRQDKNIRGKFFPFTVDTYTDKAGKNMTELPPLQANPCPIWVGIYTAEAVLRRKSFKKSVSGFNPIRNPITRGTTLKGKCVRSTPANGNYLRCGGYSCFL